MLVVGWGACAAGWLVWVSARIAAKVSGGTAQPFGISFVRNLLTGRTARAWPGTPSALVAVTAVTLVVAVAVVTVVVWRVIAARLPRHGDPVAALARNPGLAPFTGARVARAAARLRPSLAADRRAVAPRDAGLLLGGLTWPGRSGPEVYASWEDTVVAFMAPRSGKTTALGVPFVLSAPGPVIATSIKADLWAATAALRAEHGGVWLFDPQAITGQPQTWWWDPLAGLASVEAAHRIAAHFVLTVDDGMRRDLWGPAAQDLLCALLLAAAASGRTLRDVARWLDDTASPTPAESLDAAGFRALASSLRGAQNGAPETRDGIYQTARTAAKCLHDEDIMVWVTPPARPGLPTFDPSAFAASCGTLYLLSEARAGAAPLIAALTDTVMRAGRRQAERAGGRLDPPMVLALDEAANICRIADLPDLYSHLGSRGMVPVTILQSYSQGVTVWGEAGMAALWGAATKKVIGAGIDDPRLVRDLATLVGQHDVPVRSASYGDGRASEQISLRRQDILEPADIRALPQGTALLLATGARPALIGLRPWYQGRDAARIASAVRQAEDAMCQAALRRSEATTDGPAPLDMATGTDNSA